MSADLREKLKAQISRLRRLEYSGGPLALECRNGEVCRATDCYSQGVERPCLDCRRRKALSAIVDELVLLASHEEREGGLPACPSCGETDEVFVKDPLVRLGCYRCGPYWRKPWQTLRPHTDREPEPDGWLWKDPTGCEDQVLDAGGGPVEGFRPFVYIGPPVQPEEES